MSESVFADDLHIKGTVTSKGDVKLNGVVEGDISARKLVTAENAKIDGSATAEKVVIGGNVKGQVYGDMVKLASSANAKGELICEALSVDEDAYFEGTSMRVENPSKDSKPNSK